MESYLRRYVESNIRNGMLQPTSFRCNEDSLSFYIREDPLNTSAGASEMCRYFSERDQVTLGAYELNSSDLEKFGLNPRHCKDDDDAVYGELHYQSLCFEHIYLEDPSGPQDNILKQLMNRKKSALAAIADTKKIVLIPEREHS